MLEPAPLSPGFGSAAGAFFAARAGEHGVEFGTGDPLAALRGRRRVGASYRVRARVRGRHRGDGHRRDAGRDARPLRRAGAGGERRYRCAATWRLSAPACGRPASLRVRLGRARPQGCGSSTGRSPALQGKARRPPRSRALRALYDEVPYFWSDLADWCTLEYVGPAASGSSEVVRGSFETASSPSSTSPAAGLAAALSVGRAEDLMRRGGCSPTAST